METEEELLERIVVNPKVMGGKPVVKGTRITVEQVLKLLSQVCPLRTSSRTTYTSKNDVSAVLLYAAKVASPKAL